jgi:hypothetical protein
MIPLEQQVTSLELSKRLKELGAPQESLFYWIIECQEINDETEFDINLVFGRPDFNQIKGRLEYYSAFTMAECNEILFQSKSTLNFDGEEYERDFEKILNEMDLLNETSANSLAMAIISLIENKLIEV